ncbi:MAG: hypothetical protein BWX89_00361 [candidate division TA06 bacterium ADurb.Bin131]|uniref:Uncharacterized protein n=1 Tax=candidate division TA06 bacterium ADurb.Bin131 TaxID=1852827 RepID=A0A1V6CD30_UNCT6|nr:MAG: hypothetical protein BWX89_00361 [candidate division TA06 bacterium ADurb.Bin131]
MFIFTPPDSVLCKISGLTIFATTGYPIVSAAFTADFASFARILFGPLIPYASNTSLA